MILKTRERTMVKQYNPPTKEKKYGLSLANITITPKATLKINKVKNLIKLILVLSTKKVTSLDNPNTTKITSKYLLAASILSAWISLIARIEKTKTKVEKTLPKTTRMILIMS